MFSFKINCITILVKGPLRGQEQEVEVNTKMNKQTNSASTGKPKSDLRKWFTCILSRRLNLFIGKRRNCNCCQICQLVRISTCIPLSLIITIGILNPFFFGNFGSQVKEALAVTLWKVLYSSWENFGHLQNRKITSDTIN